MSALECSVQKIQKPEEPTLTVGERFLLSCSGSVPELDAKTAELRVDASDKYSLKLLRFERSSKSELRLEVLSDRVGAHDLQGVQIVDASQSVLLSNLKFEVRSVQDPQSPVQEPFGAMGPLSLSIPLTYWMGLLALISVIGILVSLRVLKKLERRRLMTEIQSEVSPAQPENELFQKLRKIKRESEFLIRPHEKVGDLEAQKALAEMDSAYRIFLSRFYGIPFARWQTKKGLRVFLREQQGLSEKNRRLIAKVLRELDRAVSAEMRGTDLVQLLEWISDSAGLIVKEGGRR